MKKLIDFPYSRILVLGLAKSGTAAAKLLIENDRTVRVNDIAAKEEEGTVTELMSMGAEIILGSHPDFVLDDIEIVVKNPGIPYDNPVLSEADKRGIPIITEIELAYFLTEGLLIGITGSNGKTTTTTLITEMLTKSDQPVKIAGNIGLVATDVAQTLTEKERLVLELSSFQLMGIDKFRPNIAVLLNIYEAHLDYHKSMENYKAAKFNIFKNQSAEDYLVYNADDSILAEAVQSANAYKIPFSVKKPLKEHGAWLDDEWIYFREEKIANRSEIVLVGEHNLENILAAIAAAKLNGASNEAIKNVLLTFSGVKHRLQFIMNHRGRLFYNDSKATNILATQKALASFNQPVILLAGGLDRGNEFTDLIPYLKSVKAVVAFGQTKEKLKHTADSQGLQTIMTEDVQQAVEAAYKVSAEGDVILLSPACASWDQYRTFEQRGDMFIQAVHTLL
ncbi:UDP-N-acetylmuramoyl-L-alanine--D-glutamate ligase [Virgibacillus oceani]